MINVDYLITVTSELVEYVRLWDWAWGTITHDPTAREKERRTFGSGRSADKTHIYDLYVKTLHIYQVKIYLKMLLIFVKHAQTKLLAIQRK